MMKKLKDRSFDIFAVISVCGIWFYYRNDIAAGLNDVFLSLFGKNLSGRNLLLRIVVIGGLFLLSLLLPLLFDRLICRKPACRKFADGVILGILMIPLARLMVICANQTLRRDDYWEIADARQFGFPGSMFVEIRRYNGRYLSWGLRSLYAVLPPIPFIDILLFLNILIFVTGISLLALQLLKCQTVPGDKLGIRLTALTIGAVLAFAGIRMASNIWEVWFWGSGVMVYGLGLSLCVLTSALILRIAADPSRRGRKLIFPAVLCFLACGCSELCIASLAVFIMIMLIRRRFTDGKWDKRLLFFCAEVLVCCAGVFLLSGSVDYAGGYAHLEGKSGESALRVLISRLPSIFSWAFNALWGYLFINWKLLLFFSAVFFVMGTQLRFDGHIRRMMILTAVMLVLTGQGVLLINSALDYMPPRVVTIGICWVMIADALLCFTVGSFLSSEKRQLPDRAKTALCAFLLSLCVGRFYSAHIDEVRTIRGSWAVRDIVLREEAKKGKAVETCSLPSPGSFRQDILEDAEDEFNIAVAYYYGIPSIRAEHRCPPYGDSFTEFPPD